MSSAILYLAIVAIWAGVLVPRWLRRDQAHGAVNATADTATPAPDGSVAPGEVSADDDTADVASETMARSGDADDEAPRTLPSPLNAEESRRRVLTARRRLLGMLGILEAAAIALAVIGLAAMWVVVPPTIMLAGYLLLLREAAHADAEHAQREAEATAARSQALGRPRRGGRTLAAQHPTPAEGTPSTAEHTAGLAAKFAAAPVPADYEDSGRDFAPGLAGKYTPSNADSSIAGESHYSYEAPRLRAVGD